METKSHINRNQRLNNAASFFAQWYRYKRLLSTHWWIILAALGLCLGIQWFLNRRLAPTFVSTGQMIVNVKLSIPSENTYSEELENFFGTQVALMQSDSVKNRVALRLQSFQPEWRQEKVKIQVALVPRTSIFNLTAVGDNSRCAQAALEATMEEYINLKKDLLANASTAAKSNIQDQLVQLELKLERSKQDYLDFQSSNSIVLLQEDGGNNAAAYLSALNKQLADSQAELKLLKSLTLNENLERSPDAVTTEAGIQQSVTPNNYLYSANSAPRPTFNTTNAIGRVLPVDASANQSDGFEGATLQAREQIALLKAKRDKLNKLAPDAFELVGLNDEIGNQEKLLEFLQEQGQEKLNNRKHTLEVQIQNLNDQVKEWNAKALDASKKLSAFGALKENHQQLQAMYDQLVVSLQTLDLDKGAGQESVTILEPATPAVPTVQKTLVHMVMAGLIGLVAGFGVIMILDLLNDKPGSYSELEALFVEPVLAQLPLIRITNKRACVLVLNEGLDQHMVIEAFQNLRSALVYKDTPGNPPRSIVIASATAQDGKSTVAANLAVTLAQSGSRVLLVDADLRRGILHEQFAVPSEPGLAEVLAERCDWANAVVTTAVPNLFLLPSGARPARPGSLFAMSTGKFLADIAGHYDYYLFDTTPVMAADDVSSLAPHVDGVIMVIRAGVTSGRLANTALDLLRLRKVKVIGLAFNAVQTGGGYQYYQDKNYYVQSSAN